MRRFGDVKVGHAKLTNVFPQLKHSDTRVRYARYISKNRRSPVTVIKCYGRNYRQHAKANIGRLNSRLWPIVVP